MSADDAVGFQHGPSALSFLLLCTGSSKDQICFTDFACFQVSSAFSVLIWLVQMHKFLFAVCQVLASSRLRL